MKKLFILSLVFLCSLGIAQAQHAVYTWHDGFVDVSSSANVDSITFALTCPVPETVDLGGSVLWATFNLGASKPEGYGMFFAWGEDSIKSFANPDNYKFVGGSPTKYNSTDQTYTLSAEDDAATVNLGSGWRMPTQAELKELRDQCTSEWTTVNGVSGYKMTSKTNGNSIFLPAAGRLDVYYHAENGTAGYYWSSQCASSSVVYGIGLNFNDSETNYNYTARRWNAYAIRPVHTK